MSAGDGQKPINRRILIAQQLIGLSTEHTCMLTNSARAHVFAPCASQLRGLSYVLLVADV
jgi:hypothetical protein